MFGAIGAAGRVLGPALELILPRVLSRYATVVAGIMLGNHIDTCAGLTQADPREFGVQLFHTALAAIPMEFMAHGATAATRPALLRGNASIYERAARRGWINESDAAPFIAGAREMIEAQNQAIQRGLRNAGRFLKLMVAAPALLAFGAVPGGGGGSGSGGGEYEVPITRGSDRGQRVDGMIERVRKNQAQSEGRLPLTADESYVQPPDTRQLLVEMVVPEGMSSEALQQALSRLAGATGSSALEQALEGISFRRLSGPFESDAIEMRPRTDAEGIFDIIPQGENAPRYSEHVVPVDAAIQNPTLLGQVRQLLIPNAVGPFKNALEYCEARRANRPILGGVADPTSEQLVRHQQVAARRSLLWRLADLYYRPRSFERSNRLYESLGVSLFRRVVVGFVGRVVLDGLFGGLKKVVDRVDGVESTSERQPVTNERNAGVVSGMGLSYFLGADRTLDRLRDLDMHTRQNERLHAVIQVGYGYMLGTMTYWTIEAGAWHNLSGAALAWSIWVLNGYATLLQRQNRIRIHNTIDMKLRQGAFAPDNDSVQQSRR